MQNLTRSLLIMLAMIFSQTWLIAMKVSEKREERIICTQQDYNRVFFMVTALITVPVLGAFMLYHHEPTQFEKTSEGLAWLVKHYQTLIQTRKAIEIDSIKAALTEQLVQRAVALAKTFKIPFKVTVKVDIKVAVEDEQLTAYITKLLGICKQHIGWLAARYEFHHENWPDNKYQQQLCVQLQALHDELVALDAWLTGWLAQAANIQAAPAPAAAVTA